MLYSLHVKNLALIEETEVEFGEGLNILTGETGAGKSILLGSVNLALGAKAGSEIIRNGAESALVELTFDAREPKIREKLEEMELPVEDTLTISRKISSTRSISRINGETVTAKQLKELSEYLIDIHGQHEHQSLLQKKKHLSLLDAYAGKEAEQYKEKIEKLWEKKKQITEEMEAGNVDEAFRKRELDLLTFEYEEIENASLKADEDVQLEERYEFLKNGRKIAEALSVVHEACGGEDGAGLRIDRALREMSTIAKYEERLENFYSELLDAEALLGDLDREVSDYMEDMSFDEGELVRVEDRLNEINHLKDKFGGSIEAVLKYQKSIAEKMEKLADYETYMAGLKESYERVNAGLLAECEKLSKIREKAGVSFAAGIKEALEDMNFLAVDFEVQQERKEPAKDGFDDVEFLISTNPGEPKKSLSQIASGGELSRIMLALKTMIAGKDEIDTLIFDEIDAGISGKTAWRVAEKLSRLSGEHQVICITHLPQIAAMSDTHFEIRKETDGSSTSTAIHALDESGQQKELARLLGADELSAAALENAKEMKNQALKLKQN